MYLKIDHGQRINTGVLYKVRDVDNLSEISQRFGMHFSAFLSLNPDVAGDQDAVMAGKHVCLLQQVQVYNRCDRPSELPNPLFYESIVSWVPSSFLLYPLLLIFFLLLLVSLSVLFLASLLLFLCPQHSLPLLFLFLLSSIPFQIIILLFIPHSSLSLPTSSLISSSKSSFAICEHRCVQSHIGVRI